MASSTNDSRAMAQRPNRYIQFFQQLHFFRTQRAVIKHSKHIKHLVTNKLALSCYGPSNSYAMNHLTTRVVASWDSKIVHQIRFLEKIEKECDIINMSSFKMR